jgi:hypothetical protein
MPLFMALKEVQLDDPATDELYRELGDAIGWSPDDPRLPGLADKLVATLEAEEEVDREAWEALAIPDDLVALLDSVFLDLVPMAPRLLRLLEERGWTGWTRLERLPSVI